MVEAIDKKQNFPAPRPAGPSSPGPSERQPQSPSSPLPAKGNTAANKGKVAEEPKQQKVITPELRKLLSRKVEVLPRKTVAQKGDGMPAK